MACTNMAMATFWIGSFWRRNSSCLFGTGDKDRLFKFFFAWSRRQVCMVLCACLGWRWWWWEGRGLPSPALYSSALCPALPTRVGEAFPFFFLPVCACGLLSTLCFIPLPSSPFTPVTCLGMGCWRQLPFPSCLPYTPLLPSSALVWKGEGLPFFPPPSLPPCCKTTPTFSPLWTRLACLLLPSLPSQLVAAFQLSVCGVSFLSAGFPGIINLPLLLHCRAGNP